MALQLFQVDAFASGALKGNPAAVVPLERWIPDELLLSIAAENNLSDTAFFLPCGDAYEIRWMTPSVEVDLCGHATLATAWVILNELTPDAHSVQFESKSGPLRVERSGDLLTLDFPSRPPFQCANIGELGAALGATPTEVWAARDYLVVFEHESDVRNLKPNMRAVAVLDRFAVIATAPGDECDFVSRFFAPAQGLDEDPVTGSAHCTLAPYWAARLGKTHLTARQISQRGGALECEVAGDRVKISGAARLYMRAALELS